MLLVMVLAVLSAGCRFGGATSEFAEVTGLEQLEGTYMNMAWAEGGPESGRQPIYLSRLVWPDDADLVHDEIDTIEVENSAERTLTLVARSGETISRVGEFVEGEDFAWRDGKIFLGADTGFYGLAPGEVFVGVGRERRTLGLDPTGHGKYRQRSYLAGLGFLIVPVAGYGDRDVRFVRLGD